MPDARQAPPAVISFRADSQAGFGIGRRHAKGHDAPIFGSRAQCGDDAVYVALDHMIGGQDQQHGVRVFAMRADRGGQPGGAGVTAHRFANDTALQLHLVQLPVHERRLPGVGDTDRVAKAVVAVALHGGLEIGQAAFALGRPELFWLVLPRQRPQPRAHAATRHNGSDRLGHGVKASDTGERPRERLASGWNRAGTGL